MFYTKENSLFIFKKAFDSLDWTFLDKALSAFNLSQSFIKWVNKFYFKIQSCVMSNGFSSAYFDVRQVDPLSPFLFIISLETLAVYT